MPPPGTDRPLGRCVVVVGVGGAAPDEVVLVPPGRLPLTSSGKLQRNEVRRRYLLGTLAEPDVDG